MLFMNLILWLRKKQLKTTFFPTHFLTVKTNNGWKQSQQRLFIKNDLIHLFQHDMRKQTYKCSSISTPGWLRFRLKIQKLTSPTQCYQPKATIVKVATKTFSDLISLRSWRHCGNTHLMFQISQRTWQKVQVKKKNSQMSFSSSSVCLSGVNKGVTAWSLVCVYWEFECVSLVWLWLWAGWGGHRLLLFLLLFFWLLKKKKTFNQRLKLSHCWFYFTLNIFF